ncbi:MAG: hypothetical protein QM742_16390 [Aquabacterium sp.]
MNVFIANPDLDEVVTQTPSIQAAFLQVMGAIAAADGAVSIAEYGVLVELASRINGSSIAAYSVAHHILRPVDVRLAMSRLKQAADQESTDVRRALLQGAMPMLVQQGDAAVPLAQDLARNLGLSLTALELGKLQGLSSSSSWWGLPEQKLRQFLRRDVVRRASHCVRLTGSAALIATLRDFVGGRTEIDTLEACMRETLSEFSAALQRFESSISGAAIDSGQSKAYRDAADLAFRQVNQRLAVVAARLRQDKLEFDEDLEEFINDSANSFEKDIVDRFKSADWKDGKAWEAIRSSDFGKGLERRISRMSERSEHRLRLYQDELRLFAEEYDLMRAQVLSRPHHTQLAGIMPGLRMTTSLLNTLEDAANVAVGGGLIAGLGLGAAVYTLGAAVVLPIVAPAMPFVGGAIVVGGVIRYFMDPMARRDGEIQHKRAAFERELRQQVSQIRESYFAQLDAVLKGYQHTARIMVEPLVLEAEALSRLPELEKLVGQHLVTQARASLRQLGGDRPAVEAAAGRRT